MSRVLILANDEATIYNFRREFLKALVEAGHEVIVSVPEAERAKVFVEMGCKLATISVTRAGTNPLEEVLVLGRYLKLIKKIKPDIVLTYTQKQNIYGSFACKINKVPYMNTVTGVGRVFQKEGLLKNVTCKLQKLAFKNSSCFFFQNTENLRVYREMGIVADNICLLPGSGVNISKYQYKPYPEIEDKTKFVFVSRLRKDKGFDEFFEAVKNVTAKTDKAEFHVIGWFEDDEYKAKIEYMQENYPVIFHGTLSQEEVYEVVSQCHCLVHPSYHEGMANVILEASSAGRPCMASNIHGCLESIEHGETGFLFDVKSVESLTQALLNFLEISADKREQMGKNARKKMENEFDRNIVVNEYMKQIDSVLK